jgi:diguanylate cyclase (GGDEF)-like protein
VLIPFPPSRRHREADERVAKLAGRFEDVLRVGDGRAAELLIVEALAADISPEVIQSFVITPAMVRIGEMWERAELGIADEHLATSISQQSMVRLFEAMSVRRGRVRTNQTVLLAAVEGQHHVLGLRMIADVLEGAGYHVLYLGADVPVASLRAFASERQPALAGLGFGVASNLGRLADSIAALHDVSPETRIMLGGRAVPAEFRSAYRYVAATTDVRQAVEVLLASPAQPIPHLVALLRSDRVRADHDDMTFDEVDSAATRMSSAAEQAVDLARERFRRSQAYRDLTFRDALTDLANRRAFEDEVSSVAENDDIAAAVMMIDVDGFKQVNDAEGHEAGDEYLQAIAQSIGDAVRPGDLAARVGGDEFAVLLPATTMELACVIGERVRAAVADNPILSVSLSIGIAPMHNDARVALLAADTALYNAKAEGRNRVVSSTRPGFSEPRKIR